MLRAVSNSPRKHYETPKNWSAPPGRKPKRCYLYQYDIDQAVRNARVFALQSLGQARTENIRLEEIESSVIDSKPVWLITLSHGTNVATAIMRQMLGADAEREYKVFTVTKDTGEVLSMKIRLLAVPEV